MVEDVGHHIGNRRDDAEKSDSIEHGQSAHTFQRAEIRDRAYGNEGEHDHHSTHRSLHGIRAVRCRLDCFREPDRDGHVAKPRDNIPDHELRETEPDFRRPHQLERGEDHD